METKERVFRHSIGKLVLMSLGEVLFIFLAYFLRTAPYFFVVVVVFLISLLVFLRYVTSRVKVSDEEITTNGLLGSKSLKWSEIEHVSTRGQSLRLHDRDESMTLTLDSQLDGYIEILDMVFKRRPDLFNLGESNVFSRGIGNHILVIGFGLMVIFISGLSFIEQDHQDINWLFAPIFLGLGLSIIVLSFLSPQKVVLENQTLSVKYLFKETSYKVSDINSITLEKRRTRDGYVYFVQVGLKTGKSLKLSGFKQGSALTYQILKRWHEKAVSVPNSISTTTF